MLTMEVIFLASNARPFSKTGPRTSGSQWLKATRAESSSRIRTFTINGELWETAYVLRNTITQKTGSFREQLTLCSRCSAPCSCAL